MVKAMRFFTIQMGFLGVLVFVIYGMGFSLSHVKCFSEPVARKSRPYSAKNCKTTPFDQPKPN